MASFLIADDSPEKTAMLLSLLQREGWPGRTFTAVTTEEAKRIIDREPEITGAFIDYYIPSENGPAVIRYLTSAHPRSRSALVSSSDFDRNCREALQAGAETTVCTSYDAERVESVLLALLREWRPR